MKTLVLKSLIWGLFPCEIREVLFCEIREISGMYSSGLKNTLLTWISKFWLAGMKKKDSKYVTTTTTLEDP